MVIKNDEVLKKVLGSVKEDIFKDVRYFMTGTASDVITQIILKGGAKQEVHITDFVTHLIVGNDPDENEVGEVRDIYQKPVVTAKWAVLSAKCGQMLPTKAFDPDISQLFSGVKASLSKVSSQDARSLWGLITFYGGQCILHFDNTCTHLIVGEPKGVKLQRAYDKKVLIVTPDWVTESVEAQERKDEFFYHPRLLNLSPSATPLPPSAYSKECHELKKFQAEREAEFSAFSDQVRETLPVPVYQQAEPPDQKGIFDALVFSDDDDEISNPEQKSLLDQLKSAQTWKSSSSSSSPVQLAVKATERNDIFPIDSNSSSKPLFDTVGDAFSSQSFGIDSSLLSSLLDDNSSKEMPAERIQCELDAATPAMSDTNGSNDLQEAVSTSNPVTSCQGGISFNDSYVAYAEKQLSSAFTEKQVASVTSEKPLATPVYIEKQLTAAAPQVAISLAPPVQPKASSITEQSSQITSTQLSGIPSTPLMQLGMNPVTSIQSGEFRTNQNVNPNPPAMQQYQSTVTKGILTQAQNQLITASNMQTYNPPQVSFVTNSGNPATPTVQSPMQHQLQGFMTDVSGQKIGRPVMESPSLKQVVDGAPHSPMPQISYDNKMSLSTVPTGAPVRQQKPMEMPSSIVRLPVGITQQQFRMMAPEEKQRFIEQLHQKQVLEQQQLGANSMQIRTAVPNTPIRTPQGQLVQQQPVQGWPNSIPQHRLRTTVPQYAQSHAKPQPGAGMGQLQSWQSQGVTGQANPNVSVSGQSTSFQLPQSASDGHPPQSPLTPQSPLPSPSYVRAPQSPQVTQQVMLGQMNQAVRHVQVPAAEQQLRQAAPQQQYIVSQGTTRIVQQPGWQQQTQQSVQAAGGSQTQALMPQQAMQVQVQHLRQQFPHLGQQEAQQFLHSIPGHLRELQVRDGHGRAEYLNKLEARERQVVTAVAEFYSRKHQHNQQQQLLQRQQQQQQIKIGTPQQSPNNFQGQFTAIPQNRVVASRQLPPGYSSPVTQVVSHNQGSPRLVPTNQVGQHLTPHVSPLASPHTHSPVQREGTVAHTILQGANIAQNLSNQNSLVNAKTKTALANLLTNRLSSTVHQPGTVAQGAQGQIEIPAHVVQKAGITQDAVQGPSGEHLLVYQRRTLGNLTNNVANNVVRPSVPGGHPTGAMVSNYPRATSVTHGAGGFPVIGSTPPHYPRLHLYGHDINILPRDICMVGCVFYIADYQKDLYMQTIECIKRNIQQHGGEVVSIYDTAKVTHVLCKHQKSPVFKQAVRENKRCITIYWLDDILSRGKMAPPWQAYHLPVPFGDDEKPMRNLIVSLTGFEKEERNTIKLMLNLAGAKFTGYFNHKNHLLICKRFEGDKVAKAKQWKKPTLNAVWLSEMLLGQNVPPLSFYGSRYQHFLDDALRIDPSLSSYLFNAWKHPISVSKESVEKANAIREKALRKRKPDSEANQENKRCKAEQIKMDEGECKADEVKEEPIATLEPTKETEPPRIMFSNLKNKDELEKMTFELGGLVVGSKGEVTHLVVGSTDGSLPRTVKVMCAISSAKYIVSKNWLSDSYTLGKFACEENYTLKMNAYEIIYNFSLKEILLKPNRNRLLNGKTFYLTPSVVPGKIWFKEIIELAGGAVDFKRKPISEIRERNKHGTLEYVCITCDNDGHLVTDLLKENLPVYSGEFVLSAILRQRIEPTENLFEE